MWDMTHSYVGHDSLTCVTMTHSYVWNDSFICVTWLIHTWDMTRSHLWQGRTHTCGMTHSYMWHDAFICGTWLIHISAMTHSYLRMGSFIYVTWLIHMCVTTRAYMWHDSSTCVTWSIHMFHMNYTNTCFDSSIVPHMEEIRFRLFGSPDSAVFLPIFWMTGTPVYFIEKKLKINYGTPVKTSLKVTGTPVKTCWIFGSCNCCKIDPLRLWSFRLRLGGSLKLQASFAKEPYETGDVLQKETCNFTGLGGDLLRL